MKLEPLFQLIHYMMSDQLRSLIQQALIDFVSIFTSEKETYITFNIKMSLDTAAIAFSPTRDDYVSTIFNCFESIITSLDRIPRVETQLFVTNGTITKNPRAALANIAHDQCIRTEYKATYPVFVDELKQSLQAVLNKNLAQAFDVERHFDIHTSLINNDELAVIDFIISHNTQVERYIDELKKYRDLAVDKIWGGYPLVHKTRGYVVQCEDFLKDLTDRCITFSSKILDRVVDMNKTESLK